MELVKSSKYYDVLYDQDTKIIEIKWKPEILNLLTDEYKNVVLQAHKTLFNYEVEKLLQNTLEANYPITRDLQEWIMHNITKGILEKVKIKKVALILPTEILTKLSLEELVDLAKQKSPSIERRFFDTYSQAWEWLKK